MDAAFIDNLKRRMYLNISIRAAQKTHQVSVTETNHSTLYREIIAVCFDIHAKHINTPAERRVFTVKRAWNILLTRKGIQES
jgi:hypothetical protein